MIAPAIKVEGLWKEYTVGATQQRHGTFYDLLTHSIKAPLNRLRKLGGQAEEVEQFWALRDVNFEIQPGEVVGVIGRNGAGKSTLLKILSRITAPSRGRIEVRGRLASLLEVGTGFHAELSGRENIFLNGSILGMTRAEVARKFDEIVAFAEVDKFIDTPVKRYSSGMYVRLAFSVAAHLEPDILLIDEVLAVGDAAFQKRCLGKMHDVASAGRTVIFVSHNMGAVGQLCSRAILLERGQCSFQGRPSEAIRRYLDSVGGSNGRATFDRELVKPAQIVSMEVLTPEGVPATCLAQQSEVSLRLRYLVDSWHTGSYVCVDITNDQDLNVVWSCDVDSLDGLEQSRAPGQHEAIAIVPAGVLGPGRYFFSAAIYSPGHGTVYDVRERAVCVDIVDGGSFLSSIGVTSPALTAVRMRWQKTISGGKP